MKKTVTFERTVCDFCEKICGGCTCAGDCGKAFCGVCTQAETRVVAYTTSHLWKPAVPHAVFYCRECDLRLSGTADPLHKALLEIAFLREQYVKEIERWAGPQEQIARTILSNKMKQEADHHANK